LDRTARPRGCSFLFGFQQYTVTGARWRTRRESASGKERTNGRQPNPAIPGGGGRVQEGADRRGAPGLPQEDVFLATQAQGKRKAPGRAEDQDQRSPRGSRARKEKPEKERR